MFQRLALLVLQRLSWSMHGSSFCGSTVGATLSGFRLFPPESMTRATPGVTRLRRGSTIVTPGPDSDNQDRTWVGQWRGSRRWLSTPGRRHGSSMPHCHSSCGFCDSCGWIHFMGKRTRGSSERAPAGTPSGDVGVAGGWPPSLPLSLGISTWPHITGSISKWIAPLVSRRRQFVARRISHRVLMATKQEDFVTAYTGSAKRCPGFHVVTRNTIHGAAKESLGP